MHHGRGTAAKLSNLPSVVLFATLAGATIPIGGLLARFEHIQPRWLEDELRHSVIAFGGGILLAAVALVLVPQGKRFVPPLAAVTIFGAGGIAFFFISCAIEQRRGSLAQFATMLLDFVPESLALGAILASAPETGLLLALLIATQNLPEGFNAFRELTENQSMDPAKVLAGFSSLVLLGPLMAWIGYSYLRLMPELLGGIMLFAAGGILYLTFQSIAPQAKLERHWAPALGAVAGFMLGLLGDLLVR